MERNYFCVVSEEETSGHDWTGVGLVTFSQHCPVIKAKVWATLIDTDCSNVRVTSSTECRPTRDTDIGFCLSVCTSVCPHCITAA